VGSTPTLVTRNGLVVQWPRRWSCKPEIWVRLPAGPLKLYGRKPDIGSPDCTANAGREMIAVRVQFPLLPLGCPGVETESSDASNVRFQVRILAGVLPHRAELPGDPSPSMTARLTSVSSSQAKWLRLLISGNSFEQIIQSQGEARQHVG
jgi:hypothetical protein